MITRITILLMLLPSMAQAQYRYRYNTASQECWIGPFLDSSGAAVTTLSIANTDLKLLKEGTTSAVSKNSGGATHAHDGVYYFVLDATDTNTPGNMVINCTKSGALPCQVRIYVVAQAVYDWETGALANLPANVTQWNSSNVLTPDTAGAPKVTIKDGTGTGEIDTSSGTVIAGTVNDKTGYSLSVTPPTASQIRTEMDANSTKLADILADTNELQLDWVNGGRLDLLIDAIKAKTDPLTFTATNYLKIDVQYIYGSALSETSSGYLAAGFKKLFDVATPVFTLASVNQTGDSYARIGSTGSGLTSLAPSSTALSTATWTNTKAGYLDASISSVGGGGGGGCSGSGGTSWVISVKTTGNVPIADCRVWITTDLAGSNTIAGPLYTNMSGHVTFLLDTGTYYAWRMKSGLNFTNPQSFTVP